MKIISIHTYGAGQAFMTLNKQKPKNASVGHLTATLFGWLFYIIKIGILNESGTYNENEQVYAFKSDTSGSTTVNVSSTSFTRSMSAPSDANFLWKST